MKKISVIRTVSTAVSIMFNQDRWALIKNFSVGILQTLCIVGTTVFMQRFFDALSSLVGTNNSFSPVASAFAGLLVVTVISEVLNGYQNYLYGVYIEKGKILLYGILHERCNLFPREKYNDPDFLSIVEKAKHGVENVVELVLVAGDIFTFYGLYFALMSIYLFSLNKLLLLVLPMVFLPVLVAHAAKMRAYSKLEEDAAGLRRTMEHFQECLTKRSFLKETRFLHADSFFRQKFAEALDNQTQRQVEVEQRSTKRDFVAKLITFVGYISILTLLALELINRRISVGMFGAIFASMKMMFNLMDEVITYHIGQLSQNMGAVWNCLDIITKSIPVDKAPPLFGDFSTLKLSNVSFRYPNQSDAALTDIDMELKKGEIVALVGENGAGKSTLARILVGIYSPTLGSVESSLPKTPTKQVTRLTAAFQDFCQYRLSLSQNVRISDFDNEADTSSVTGLFASDLNNFPQDSILGVEFGGQDLSRGQWQGLALSRAFYRNADMIMLDEPTSAIDPLKEDCLFRQFAKSLEGKTCVIVTHRLASVRYADKIVVLAKGRIIESGTHDELIKRQGIYCSMYQTQASSYD